MKLDESYEIPELTDVEEYIAELEAEAELGILQTMETGSIQEIIDMIQVEEELEDLMPAEEVAPEPVVEEIPQADEETPGEEQTPAAPVAKEVEAEEAPVKIFSAKKLGIIIGAVALAAILAVTAWYFLAVDNIARVLNVEAGSAFSAEDFKIFDFDTEAVFTTDVSVIDTSIPGEYPVTISYYGRQWDRIVRVVDSVAPMLTAQDLILFSVEEPKPEDFILDARDGSVIFYAFAQKPDMTVPGEQDVRILAMDLGGNATAVDAKLTVLFDDVAPSLIGVKDIQQYLGWEIDFMDGVYASDNLDVDVKIDVDTSDVNFKKDGEYTVRYTATDRSDNKYVESAKVTIVDDVTGPEILGVNKLSIYQGSSMSYRRGVIVTDDYAQSPVLTIDSSAANLTEPGKYTIVYTAIDDVGNQTVRETTLTVKKQPSSYVDEEVVYAKADEILAKIITDDMDTKEQVEAIAKWFKRNCSYVSYSDKTDRMQAAYKMMTRKYGDCFNYYAACSVMLERLDIPQISVERSRNSVRRTRHYWSMVSLDGGETYYHVDVSPHYSFSIKTVLVTDATLKRCNRYLAGYYTMDSGLYPATPENPPE